MIGVGSLLHWGAGFYQTYDKQPPRERIPVMCPICATHTDARVINVQEVKQNEFIKLPENSMSLHCFFLQCTHCKGPMLYLVPVGNGTTADSLMFPIPLNTDEKFAKCLPPAIYEDLRQAQLAFNVTAYLGAGMLLRRACQNICRDKECQGKDLYKEIDDLVSKNLITRDMAEMAHSVRIIGNEIAHPSPNEVLVITADDVRICYAFLKQLVQVIYVNPFEAKKMRERLGK